MSSMRRLNRRLARWQRYSARYRDRCDYAMPWGQIRAKAAVVDEIERRRGYDDDFHRPGYEEDGSIYPAMMLTESGWFE